jgi:hypothetical protein
MKTVFTMEKKAVLNETFVEDSVRNHLIAKGWHITNTLKSKGEPGPDITAFHPNWRKNFIIEAKGEASSYKHQAKHTAIPTVLGQILLRMDREGNRTNRGRIYAIAIPITWENILKNKILKMGDIWEKLRLKTFLVHEDGKVEEKTYSYFLK